MKHAQIDIAALPASILSQLARRRVWARMSPADRAALLAGVYGTTRRLAREYGCHELTLQEVRSWIRIQFEAYQAGEAAAREDYIDKEAVDQP